MKRNSLGFLVPVAAGILGLTLGWGALSANGDGNERPTPTSLSTVESSAGNVKYNVNADGQTYGSVPADWQGDVGQLPDLVEVVATNGDIGYMPKEVVFPQPDGLQSRSETKSSAPVFDKDGNTRIGDFVFEGKDG